MVVLAAALIGVLVGVAVGFGAYALRHRFRTARDSSRTADEDPPVLAPVPGTTGGLAVAALDVLGAGAAVLDIGGEVVLANPAARTMGVVRGGRLMVEELRKLARTARREGQSLEVELDLPRGRLGREPIAVCARLTPIGPAGHVALLVEDITEARRVESVRRDFVANVSHELKTPVGAMSLLAEALLDASDDPEAVRRFAIRMQHESGRLGRLVQELIDLSRLQGAEPLPGSTVVAVDQVVAEALDRTRLAAAAGSIEVVTGGDHGQAVLGNEGQLVTALANLLDNAIAYSPEHTRVAVAVRRRDDAVEISVTDQGIGIPEREIERIFERFYRSDPARSRATGGTGLGLAIVKHVASNHGGSVSVWSVEGSGSTFTLRLPAAPESCVAAAELTPSAVTSLALAPGPVLPARPEVSG